MTRMTFTARGLALLAIAFLGCDGPGDEVTPRVSTQRKELTGKAPASLGSECVSAQQPRLIVAPSEDAPESAVQLEGKELNCGETYKLVVSGPDGTKTSESLVADAQGSVQSNHVISNSPEEHDARLYDSRGEEVAQLLYHSSNFRYGHLTWRAVGPRTAEFSLVNVFRRVYPGSGSDGLAVTGDTFQELYDYTSLCFGDGSCTGALTYRVTSYDAAQGWLKAEAITSTQLQELPGTGVTVVEAEPNDTLDTTNSMQLGDDYSSNISLAFDSDHVRFTLPQRTSIQIGTVLQTLGDSFLYLYDGNGAYLTSDDDSGPGLASLIQITLEAGTYYIGAAAFGSGSGQQLVQLRQMGIPPSGLITHTYSSDGPFTASISGCCRIGNLGNSGNDSFKLQTRVGFRSANSAPVSSLPPMVEAPTRTPDFSFQIPATDAEGDALTFRLATSSESYLWSQPPGLTVSSTGLVRWNTSGTVSGQLWAVQVIIEERREGVLIGSSAVDFLLRITGDSGSPPTCVPPPQARYTVLPGHTLRFTVGTQDPDDWDTVTLSASGLPWNTISQPSLPLQGPGGISSTLSYTPSIWDVGYLYWSVFTVTDSTGQSSQCAVRIEVLSPDNWPPVANAGSDRYVNEGATVTLDGTGSSDREGRPLTYQWTVVSNTGAEVTLSSATSATPSFIARNQGSYTFRLTVTDSEGATGSDTVNVYVANVAPSVSASGGQVDEGQEFTSAGSFTDPGADSWTATVDYGDGTGVQPLALAHGTFTLSHRYLDNADSYWEQIYWVRIVVTDDSGAQGSTSVPVDVRNVAPVILTLPPSLAADPGQPLLVPITFTDPGADSWWVWVDYGDGYSDAVWVSGQEFTLAHTYYSSGTYSLRVTLSDDDGGSQTVTLPVEIHNLAPIVSVQGGTVDEGSRFHGYGSFEDPGGGWWEPHAITVDYGDGTGVQPVEPGYWDPTDFWLSHEYSDSGTYLVTVTVTDAQGAVGTATATVVVNNVAPWVYLAEQGYGSAEGSELVLNGYADDPGTQDTLTATVDYGDGTGMQPLEVNNGTLTLRHVYADDGRYTVTLTVADDDGGVGVATRQVYVYNVTPTVSATGGSLNEGSMFTSSGSFTDPGADTWTATVDYGDGTARQPLALNGKSFLLEHVYADSGTYWVSITVRDSDGAAGSTRVFATVRNVAPVVSAPGGTLNEGSTFTSSVSITDPGNEGSWTAWIDYGDGSYGQWLYYLNSRSFTLNHVYAENGTYTVTIRVYDGEGEGTTTTQVVVHNVAPTVTATGGGPLYEGSTFTSSASYTDPGYRDTVVAQVDYGDGSPVETLRPYWNRLFTLSHRYADSGTYLVRISVIDDDGGVGTTTVPVEVRNIAPVVTSVVGCSPDEGSLCMTSGQFTDPGADSWTITVNFGDGSAPRELSLAAGSSRAYAASHVYDDNGLYTVVVTITDDDGASATSTHQVRVRNVAPTVTASNDSPRYWGVPVNLTGTVMDPSQADTQAGFTAVWTLGDGRVASSLTTAHAYAAPGTYRAGLHVTDKDGSTNLAPAMTAVTIQKRPGAVTCQDTTAMFGFPVALSARFVDGLAGGLPADKRLSFRLGDSTGLGSVTTDALGQASVQSPGELMPGSYPITVSFAEGSHYTAAEASCTLTVTQTPQGKITGGGLRLPNQSRGGLNVMREEGGPCTGELQFQNEGTSFHASEMTALGISADKRQGWFAGVDRDGRPFTAYVEDNDEPGTADVFKLWIDGVLQTGDGDGTISGGNIQIH